MIFYLAALQQIPPSLGEAAALEGASRWNFFRRVQFPLLMPTTLFVLVNAVINAFRMVDHIIVMTRGGPDNATTLLLFHIYRGGLQLLGHEPSGGADRDPAAACSRAAALRAVRRSRAADPLPMSARARHRSRTRRPASARALETAAAWLLADPLDAAARSMRCGRRSIRPSSRRASRCSRR